MSSKTRKAFHRVSSHSVVKRNGSVIFDSTSINDSLYDFIVGANGFDRPNWRSVVKAHQNATNQYSSVYITESSSSTGSVHKTYRVPNSPPPDYSYDETTEGFLGTLPQPWSMPSGDTATANRAIGAFSQIAYERISPFAGGVFLGELREAIHMIRNPAQSLFDKILREHIPSAKRRRNRASPRNKKQVVADSWLESVFGWLPLISDVKSGAEAVSRVVNGFIPSEIIVGPKCFLERQIQPPTLQLRSFNNHSWTYYTSVTETVSYRVKGAVRMQPAGSLQGSLETFGIAWDTVLPTIWELIPMSFVTDYFSNIGTVISSASFVDSRVIWNCMSNRFEKTLINDGFTGVQGGQVDQKISVSAGKSVVKSLTHGRTALASVVPAIQFKCPGLRSMKWLNLAALAVGNAS